MALVIHTEEKEKRNEPDLYDEARYGCESVVNNDLVVIVGEKIPDIPRFRLYEICLHLRQISHIGL